MGGDPAPIGSALSLVWVQGGRGTCLPGLGLGLVSLQVQCSQQEAATTQDDNEGAAQEALLKAEEALQVGVGTRSPQGAGDLQRRQAGSVGPTRPASRPSSALPPSTPAIHPALQVQ